MTEKLSDRLVEYFIILCENNNLPPIEAKMVDDCKALEFDSGRWEKEYRRLRKGIMDLVYPPRTQININIDNYKPNEES